ncbi:hypothetical protein ACIOUG_15895 [Pseudomonas sp. NPDC087803]|uniref:hypothetical protein n=1 Tax=Pseudomonas sp. NPDC087803 TaxID=3364448 RepID=UPI003810A63C
MHECFIRDVVQMAIRIILKNSKKLSVMTEVWRSQKFNDTEADSSLNGHVSDKRGVIVMDEVSKNLQGDWAAFSTHFNRLSAGLKAETEAGSDSFSYECTGLISDVPSELDDFEVRDLLAVAGYRGDKFLRDGSKVFIFEAKEKADFRKLRSREFKAAYFKTWSEIENLI